jgi:hypothetical protein
MPAAGDTYTLQAPSDATWLTVRRPSSRDFERVQMTGNTVTLTLDEPGRWVFIWSNQMARTVDVTAGGSPSVPDLAANLSGPAYVPYTQSTGY